MGGGSCRVVISGTGGGSTRNKNKSEENSWERIKAVLDYMEQAYKISRDRFLSNYIGTATKGHLNFREARKDETGVSLEKEPHPELQAK